MSKKVTGVLAGRLVFPLKTNAVPDQLTWLTETLRRRGYILDEPREVRRRSVRSRTAELLCTFVDEPASRLWLRDEEVRERYWKGIRAALRAAPRFETDADAFIEEDRRHGLTDWETCTHRRWNALVLAPRLGDDSVRMLLCLDCDRSIPLYRAPRADDLQYWCRTWKLLNDLYLHDIGPSEAHAIEQMSDGRSKLNEDARKRCRELSRALDIPIWYAIWQDPDAPCSGCPRCGRLGRPCRYWAARNEVFYKGPEANAIRECGRCKLLFGLQTEDYRE